MSKNKKEFISNVTGEVWHKQLIKRWHKIINQVGTIIEDEVHEGKNGTSMVLKKGSKVIIDDIRGRILPQYRVRDANGKVWFVTATNVEFSFDEDKKEPNSNSEPIYRGGVRVDGEEGDVLPERYEKPVTTEEEIKKEKKDNKTNG